MARGGARPGAGRKKRGELPSVILAAREANDVLCPAKIGTDIGRARGTPNKVNRELKALAQQFTRASLATLLVIMRSKATPAAARVAAANAILDRGHGKPPQAVTGADGEALRIPPSILFVIQQQLDAENRT